MENVAFIYVDINERLLQACQNAFAQVMPADHPLASKFRFVRSELGKLEGADAQWDCIMSPANSYGRLDGGYDHFIAEELAPSPAQYNLPTTICQRVLYDQWKGYAPPGTCTLVPLLSTPCEANRHGCKYVALCPTMRTPEDVNWDVEVVYECVWSLLNAVHRHNTGDAGPKIAKVLMTGLATGIGRVSPERCAMQTALAVKDFATACAEPRKWSSLEWDQIDVVDKPLKDSREL